MQRDEMFTMLILSLLVLRQYDITRCIDNIQEDQTLSKVRRKQLWGREVEQCDHLLVSHRHFLNIQVKYKITELKNTNLTQSAIGLNWGRSIKK